MSPSTRRAWIEISLHEMNESYLAVALHPEGVDRNTPLDSPPKTVTRVALHPEGVDRNVEITKSEVTQIVALHPEGVDRNRIYRITRPMDGSRPPPGGRG